MNKRHRVLVAPLDWGLGHSSRCVPIIKSLLANNINVIIGGAGNSFELLKKEFPSLENIPIESYPLVYPKTRGFYWHFLKQLPKMFAFIKKENRLLSELITSKEIDAVISDNRYGLYNNNIPSILITHQIIPRTAFFTIITKKLLKRLIERFDQCWIPDSELFPRVAGKMSDANHLSIPVNYIGILSRLEPKNLEKTIDILAIISGPEPQRTYFEQTVKSQLNKIDGQHVVIRGIESSMTDRVKDHITVYNMLTTNEINHLINSAKYVITRSGYSSLMDLIRLNRTGLLIPTNNQVEQEYLGQYHHNIGGFICQSQDDIQILYGINELGKTNTKNWDISTNNLNRAVNDFCESLY